MTSLVHKLGLSPTLAFHDVWSIDDPEILSFVPRPANALLLLFPVSKAYETSRMEEDADKPEYDGTGAEPVIWYKQTIRNACGLIGVLHAVSNGSSRNLIGRVISAHAKEMLIAMIEHDSDLYQLINDATPLRPVDRANLLYKSKALETAHASAASEGQSSAPDANDDIDLHFVCFVKDEKNHLWEMDGRRKGPIDRGQLKHEEDVLSEKALNLGPRKFIQREIAISGGELRFSLITLAPSFG